MEYKKANEKTKTQQLTHRYREHTGGCQRDVSPADDGIRKVEDNRLPDYGVSHRSKRGSIRNIVSGTAVLLAGDEWQLHLR